MQQKEQGSDKDAPHQESIGEKIEESAIKVVEEAEEEVAAASRPWYQTRRWGGILLLVYAILLILFVLLAWWVFNNPVSPIDVMITRDFQHDQSPWLSNIMSAVSYIGNVEALSIGLIALATVIFWLVDLRLEAITVVVVSATNALFNGLIKVIVARPRPTAGLVEIMQVASGQSFPSGHVMSYIAFWGLLFSFGIIVFKGNHWWRTTLLIISALFVVLVGPSRVYLGDHWASDVLGAYIFGSLWLGICLWVYLYFKGKGVLAPRGTRAKHFHHKYVK